MTKTEGAISILVSAWICGVFLFRLLKAWDFGLFVLVVDIFFGCGVTIFLVLTISKKKKKDASNQSNLSNDSDRCGILSTGELRMLYDELGLDASASDDDVKTAYREMAKRYHPDFYEDAEPNVREAAAERFRRIGDAYALIKYIRGMK